MESVIPQHLATRRTQPAGMEPGWQPPYPSFVARFAPSVTRVVMSYFGVQYRSQSEPPAIVGAALADLAAAFRPRTGQAVSREPRTSTRPVTRRSSLWPTGTIRPVTHAGRPPPGRRGWAISTCPPRP